MHDNAKCQAPCLVLRLSAPKLCASCVPHPARGPQKSPPARPSCPCCCSGSGRRRADWHPWCCGSQLPLHAARQRRWVGAEQVPPGLPSAYAIPSPCCKPGLRMHVLAAARLALKPCLRPVGQASRRTRTRAKVRQACRGTRGLPAWRRCGAGSMVTYTRDTNSPGPHAPHSLPLLAPRSG